MTASDYVLWFIATTFAVSALLAFGTLAAAGLLRRPERHAAPTELAEQPPQTEHRHHWYDRFHHAA